MRNVTIVCGGEPDYSRHDRIETEKMEWEEKRDRRERYTDPIILGDDPVEQVKNLLYTIETYQSDLRRAYERIKELEQLLSGRVA